MAYSCNHHADAIGRARAGAVAAGGPRSRSSTAALALPDGVQSLPEMAWCAAADGQSFAFNDRWLDVTGMPAGVHDHAGWLAAVHADDRPGLAAQWAAATAERRSFEATFRLYRAAGGCVWVLARSAPVAGDVGLPLRWLVTAVDIDAIKAGSDTATLIARELAHRIGNVFGVIGGVLALSARGHPEAKDFASSTNARIEALARAHSFIWPASQGGEAAPRQVQSLIGLLVSAYVEPESPRVQLSGDDIAISSDLATWITLIVHELAMNAVKYGALSCPQGRVAIRLRQTPTQLTLVWSESGGPDISHPPSGKGFGSALIDRVTQLGQAMRARRRWRRQGLTLAIRFNLTPRTSDILPDRADRP